MKNNTTDYTQYEQAENAYREGYDEREEGSYADNAQKSSAKSIKMIFAAVIAVLIVLIILLSVFYGLKNRKGKDPEKPETETTTAAQIDEGAPYAPGLYSVSESGSLRLREDHSMTAKQVASIPSGTQLNIIEVFEDPNAASENERFWGKTEYKGWTAWVSLAFMVKDDASKPAPTGDETTTEAVTEETTTEKATEPASEKETTTAPEEEKTTSAQTQGGYSTGKYKYINPDSSLHMRDSASVSGNSIVDIPSGESLTVTEIREDKSASSDTLRYWGKISYAGREGWVCMSMLNSSN